MWSGDTLNLKTDTSACQGLAERPVSANVERHLALCKELNALYARKNHDYGDSFHSTFVEEGMAMSRIRLSDKLLRFKTLSKGARQQVSDEGLRDTLIDLANYALMTILELDNQR